MVSTLQSDRQKHREKMKTLYDIYTPSEPCTCTRCISFCHQRPGWWTVEEAERVINAGYSNRMMLEIAPGGAFGVLSPAFRGNEGSFAFREFSNQGCTFLKGERCELFGTGLQPLECRYCHHTRMGLGKKCHHDIEKRWNSHDGQSLVKKWSLMMGIRTPGTGFRTF